MKVLILRWRKSPHPQFLLTAQTKWDSFLIGMYRRKGTTYVLVLCVGPFSLAVHKVEWKSKGGVA